MTFIALDNKDWCKGIYYQGKLHFDHFPDDLRRTWKYAPYLDDRNIQYGFIFAQGKSLDDVCPQSLYNFWQQQKAKLKAYHNSFVEAKIDLNQNCFFDLVPKQFLLELCEIKTQIIDHVFETYEEPENYNLLLETSKIIHKISERKLSLDLSVFNGKIANHRARTLRNTISKSNAQINYNLFGSKTGRLTTIPGSFPILNLDKEYRSVIRPTNDLFIELDFNAAEVRTLIALSGEKQPLNDIHEWNAKRFGISRDEAKREIFSWLYGSKKIESSKYEKFFGLNKMMDQFYDGFTIRNSYKRKIKSDQFHSLNFLIQSTTNDLVLDQIIKINNLLKNKKSFISFFVHDSVVIDLAKEDREIVSTLIDTFSNTQLGKFPVNISVGKDYGNLRGV